MQQQIRRRAGCLPAAVHLRARPAGVRTRRSRAASSGAPAETAASVDCRRQYDALVAAGELRADPAQKAAVERLRGLQARHRAGQHRA
jgi:hypothetical protein